MLSAAFEWSVISMLKEFVFVVIIISAYLTWHSTFLFTKPKKNWKTKGNDDLSSYALLAVGKNKGQDENTGKEIEDTEKSQVHDTYSAFGNCLCTLSLCFFAPCTSSCCTGLPGARTHTPSPSTSPTASGSSGADSSSGSSQLLVPSPVVL